MKESDRKAFATLIFSICTSYHQSMEPARLQIYWESLSPYPFDKVKKAFNLHMNDPDIGHRFPLISHITQILIGTSETLAATAWQSVETQIRRVGVYQSPVFEDSMIMPVIQSLGGWRNLCHANLSQLPYLSVRFQRDYMQALKAKQRACAKVKELDAPKIDGEGVTEGA